MPTDVPESPIEISPDMERVLSMPLGTTTVGEALEAAITAGHVRRDMHGRLSLADSGSGSPFIPTGTASMDCRFLMHFMYRHIYRERRVPIGCSTCFKLKVTPTTLRQLMAVKTIAEALPFASKSGPEVANPQTQSLYATYFYFPDLAAAREAYRQIRPMLDAHPALGPTIKMIIKRGCTEYERTHGSLDDYEFEERQREIEHHLRRQFSRRGNGQAISARNAEAMRLLLLVRTAYQIGDDTYKDFTGGKDLYPPIRTYDPDEPEDTVQDGREQQKG